jgi:hypothetical protein
VRCSSVRASRSRSSSGTRSAPGRSEGSAQDDGDGSFRGKRREQAEHEGRNRSGHFPMRSVAWCEIARGDAPAAAVRLCTAAIRSASSASRLYSVVAQYTHYTRFTLGTSPVLAHNCTPLMFPMPTHNLSHLRLDAHLGSIRSTKITHINPQPTVRQLNRAKTTNPKLQSAAYSQPHCKPHRRVSAVFLSASAALRTEATVALSAACRRSHSATNASRSTVAA